MMKTGAFPELIAALAVPMLLHCALAPAEAAVPKSFADKDWQAYQEVANLKAITPGTEMSGRERAMFIEEQRMKVREKALVFLAEYPSDPRRWRIIMNLDVFMPRFVLQWAPDGANGEPQAIVDETAAAAWEAKVEKLQAAMAEAGDLPAAARRKLEWLTRKEAERKAYRDRWSGGNAMAPDFVTYDAANEEMKVSDYRGKVIILDFWASWCGPCKKAMPQMQELARQYRDQGVVVLASGTGDTRADFEKFVKENRDKYPDILWTHDKAERSDERASKKLYGVTGIPTQFVIDRDGKVVDVKVGYGDVSIINAALAKAGIEVHPDILAQDEADRAKREAAGVVVAQ